MLLATFGTALGQTDPTFTRITSGNIVTDQEGSISGTWGDFDGNGFLDLYVANSSATADVRNSLYRNNGDGSFTKMLTNTFLATLGITAGAAWADIDNDGDVDLVAPRFSSGPNEVLFNQGAGVFTSRRFTETGQWLLSPALADMDGDGWLDVFFSNINGLNLAYRNQGDGTFRRLTSSEVGDIATYSGESYLPSWGDYDKDGDADLVVGTATGLLLYRNDGTGKFERVSLGSLASDPGGANVQWVDYDNDGWLDVPVVGPTRVNALHRNLGGTNFVNTAAAAGLGDHLVDAWNAAWGDCDNDGDVDLFVVNQLKANTFYRNNGDGTFSSIDIGSPLQDGNRDCGPNWVDYDNDGHLDLFIASGDGLPETNLLYHNNGNSNHWLKVKLTGQASNRSGVGAKVRVTATMGGQVVQQTRQMSAGGFAEGHGLIAHFGLGDATIIDKVVVEWPSGNVQELTSQSVDRILTVTEQVYITPVRPTASLGGSVALTSQRSGTRQWYHEGVLLDGQTSSTLSIADIQLSDGGRYSVVTDSGGTFYTNFVYLLVDTQFTKINEGPLVTDTGNCAFEAVVGDYDGDGYEDIFVPRWKWGLTTLYHNDQNGTFSRSSAAPSQQSADDWEGATWGDFDNDGKLDLLAIRDRKPSFLYWNDGDGLFSSSAFDTISPWNVAVADYDRDGQLDLYFSYAFVGPNRLYRNTGNRTFRSMSATEVGLVASESTFGGAAWADYDDDGWPDLCAPDHEQRRTRMYHNERNGRFSAANNVVSSSGDSLACAWGDADNDDRQDLFIVRFRGTSQLYRNLGGGTFALGSLSYTGNYANGASWADYDNDGFLDLFISDYLSPGVLFHNNGDGSFTRVSTGSIVTERIPGATAGSLWGVWFDYDNNGTLDLYHLNGYDNATAGVTNFLYRNNGNNNAWLKVKLIGTTSNRDAVGAKVRAYAAYAGAYRWQRRDITGGDTINGGQSFAHFGLGNATVVNSLKIEWPSGIVEQFFNLPVRQSLTIVEPSLKGSLALDGKFHVAMTMSTNRVYQLQASGDLVNWTTLTNCTGSGSCAPVEYVDPEAPTAGAARFYRMK